MIKYSFKNYGFTVLEMLIVCSIIVILTSVVLANHREADAQLRLNRAAEKISQDVRRVSALALSAEDDTSCPGGESVKGYGISFRSDSDRYFLYGDCNGDGGYSSGDLDEEIILLETGVEIDSSPTFFINFSPPSPAITASFSGSIEIILKSTRYPSFERMVTIYDSGVVNVN